MNKTEIECAIEDLIAQSGSTYVKLDELEEVLKFRSSSLKGMDDLIRRGRVVWRKATFSRIVEKGEKKSRVYEEKDIFTLPDFYEKEHEIAKRLKLLQATGRAQTFSEDQIEAAIEKALDLMKKPGQDRPSLHEGQRAAVKTLANAAGLGILTGGPGTGKTFTLNVIDRVMKILMPGVSICYTAPTGKAAHRVTESTGNPASTLHMKLRITKENMDPQPVSSMILVIDESSMLDLDIADALFKAIIPGARVILVGDVDQLPSVGAGCILRDFIASGRVPVGKLTHTFRQATDGALKRNIAHIQKGEDVLEVGEDFKMHRANEIGRMTPSQWLLTAYIHEANVYGVDNVALLTPYRKHKFETGAERMNDLIQAAINGDRGGVSVEKEGHTFLIKERDRVIQLENRSECANGDIGRVVAADPCMKRVTVDFEGTKVVYEKGELTQLALAYAMSVHKSQGSEYKCVISCLLNEHDQMLKRNMIYTAVTRAKNEFILLCDEDAVRTAIDTKADDGRITFLKEEIRAA